MPVTVIWSSTNGGSAITEPLSHGNSSNGAFTSTQEIHLRHDGANPITDTTFHMSAIDTGVYGGDFTAAADQAELLEWGDAAGTNDFGGMQFNRNATGGFPGASWPDFSNKTSADGHGINVRTGVGDDSSNPLNVTTAMGASALGTIQVGATPNVRLNSRMKIPQNEGTLGTRQFKVILTFTSTT